MATNKKNKFPVIDDKKLHSGFRAFVSIFKEHEKEYLELSVNVEDVKSLLENFEGKAAITVMSTAMAVVTALPIEEFLAFSKSLKAIQKVKLLEALMEGVKPNGADNDIDK